MLRTGLQFLKDGMLEADPKSKEQTLQTGIGAIECGLTCVQDGWSGNEWLCKALNTKLSIAAREAANVADAAKN